MEELGVYRIQLDGRIGLPATIKKLSPEGYFFQPMIDNDGDRVVFVSDR